MRVTSPGVMLKTAGGVRERRSGAAPESSTSKQQLRVDRTSPIRWSLIARTCIPARIRSIVPPRQWGLYGVARADGPLKASLQT